MTPFKFWIFSICLFAMACKKEAGPNAGNVILDDTTHLGTKINIGVGYSKDFFWGRNSDEIFVNVYTPFSGLVTIYQVDLLTMKSSRVDLAEGIVKGRNFDNSSMLMVGRINNVSGYYLYHFNTGIYSLLFKVETSYGGLAVSGNALFYSAYYRPGELAPCPLDPASCADWSPSVSDFHFIDINSKKIVPLPKKTVLSFSKTGKKTVLVRSPDTTYITYDSAYIFDNDKGMLVDSLKINPVGGWFRQHGTIYFDDETGVVKEYVVDNGDVAIINAKTGDIIQKFRPSVFIINELGFVWSNDGTKLFYDGYKNSSFSTSEIGIYDLISKKETVFEIGKIIYRIIPSLDNKKILYQLDTDWYIKKVQ